MCVRGWKGPTLLLLVGFMFMATKSNMLFLSHIRLCDSHQSIYCNLSVVATLDLVYKRTWDLRYLCFSFDWWRNLGFSSCFLACNWRSRPCDSVAPFEARCDFFVKFRLPWSLTGSPVGSWHLYGRYLCMSTFPDSGSELCRMIKYRPMTQKAAFF